MFHVNPDDPSDQATDPAESTDGPDDLEREDHEADGLDLARTMNRVVAGTTPAAKQRRRFPSVRTQRVTGSGPDDRDPQLVKSLIERLVGDHGWDVNLRVHGIFGRWPELVGEDIGAHATPESFNDGVLTVRTDSTAWATQLSLLAPQILARLNEELGHGTVTTIDVRGPQGPTWKKGRYSAKGRGPRDTYG
jgi:predicted nucleic acid-binding Zn ribbon protein